MNKEKYIQLIEEHRVILEKSRKIIDKIFDKISDEVENINAPEKSDKTETEEPEKLRKPRHYSPLERFDKLTDIATKLNATLLKIIVKEQELALIDPEKITKENSTEQETFDDSPISQEDIEMMEQFLRDHNRAKMRKEEQQKNSDESSVKSTDENSNSLDSFHNQPTVCHPGS